MCENNALWMYARKILKNRSGCFRVFRYSDCRVYFVYQRCSDRIGFLNNDEFKNETFDGSLVINREKATEVTAYNGGGGSDERNIRAILN